METSKPEKTPTPLELRYDEWRKRLAEAELDALRQGELACVRCRHFEEDTDASGVFDLTDPSPSPLFGRCNRYPPVLVGPYLSDKRWSRELERERWQRPPVHAWDTCGEWNQPPDSDG